ncbi:MAG: tyrosine-type recombinase/integrase [Parasporobacterium sp.]|nr:tyrosine-type recombinase/integrase [Parasporobacterium sp.]
MRTELIKYPDYIEDFHNYLISSGRGKNVCSYYLAGICSFMEYQADTDPLFADIPLNKFPLTAFSSYTSTDMDKYRNFLISVRMLSPATVRLHFSSLRSFYKYLYTIDSASNDPFRSLKLPKAKPPRAVALDSVSVKELLDGILRNDRCLAETEDCSAVSLPITEAIWIRREPLVLRNHAIISLLLGSGLKISQLAALNIDDISTDNKYLVISNISEDSPRGIRKLYFGPDTALSLNNYINGIRLPSELLDNYLFKNGECYNWCMENRKNINFNDKLVKDFPDRNEMFYEDMKKLTACLRRQGREYLKPAYKEKALFLSSRGTRMTVRMIQIMIKEMVRTYLPDYLDKDVISPEKLRNTCAARLISQTGDLTLTSSHLGKSPRDTARIYSALKRSHTEESLAGLSLTDW